MAIIPFNGKTAPQQFSAIPVREGVGRRRGTPIPSPIRVADLPGTPPDLVAPISGIETLHDPADSGILAMARQFFRERGRRHATQPEPNFRHND
jgi:hypothetical protein